MELTPKGINLIPKGIRITPKGMKLSPKGMDVIPKGMDATPKGIRMTPKGLKSIPLVVFDIFLLLQPYFFKNHPSKRLLPSPIIFFNSSIHFVTIPFYIYHHNPKFLYTQTNELINQ